MSMLYDEVVVIADSVVAKKLWDALSDPHRPKIRLKESQPVEEQSGLGVGLLVKKIQQDK